MKYCLTMWTAVFIGSGLARADLVIIINTDDSATVTIAGNPAGLSSTTDVDFSLDILDFFTSNQIDSRFSEVGTGTLADATNGKLVGLDDAGITNGTTLFVDTVSEVDPNDDHSFIIGLQAFNSGVLTLDMSAVSSALPAAGASGNVVTMLNQNVIGTWQAVPEPSPVLLLGAIVLGCVAYHFALLRFRSSNDVVAQ